MRWLSYRVSLADRVVLDKENLLPTSADALANMRLAVHAKV